MTRVRMPVDMRLYPPNWPKFSKYIRFERAKGRCECEGECGLHCTHPGPRRCVERDGHAAKFARGKIVLTVAHQCKCHPPCTVESHVKAMCQRCHLRVDLPLHVSNAKKNAVTAEHRKAGLTAAESKGPLERNREALMAAWTRKHGKDDSKNPYSKRNYTVRRSTSSPSRPS